jgi:hypothetical protein
MVFFAALCNAECPSELSNLLLQDSDARVPLLEQKSQVAMMIFVHGCVGHFVERPGNLNGLTVFSLPSWHRLYLDLSWPWKGTGQWWTRKLASGI